MPHIINSPRPGAGLNPKKHDTSPGTAGNVSRTGVPMRQWSAPSYDPATGRSVSSVDEQGARNHVWANNHGTGNAQVQTAFAHVDARRTQDRTPVRKRSFSKVVD